jgi:WD40 repeat protein
MRNLPFLSALALLIAGALAPAQESALPPADTEPMLRLEAGGPTTVVNSLAFAPDGRTLYAAGFDKVVRAWSLDKDGRFALEKTSYRVPIGAGLDGALNALAVSSDGLWVAAGGTGVVRGGPGGRGPGLVVDKVGGMTPAMWRDQGVIFVFNTARPGDVHVLRGHKGPVLSLAFAPVRTGQPPVLVSAAREYDGSDDKRPYVGAARVWDVDKAEELAVAWDLPDPFARSGALFRPGLAAWRTGDGAKDLHVAMAWGDGRLRVWDVADGSLWKKDERGQFNDPLAAVPSERRAISAGVSERSGQVRLWDVAGKDGPEALRRFTIPAPHEEVTLIPRGLAPFSTKAEGAADHVAVVLRARAAGKVNREHDGECWLQLIDLKANGERPEHKPLLLWKDTTLPAVAAAPGGEYLAVAGNSAHEIRVYAVKDLLAGRDAFQRLRSAGAAHQYVAFVTRGEDAGLLLSEAPAGKKGAEARDPKGGDLIFDFTKRELSDDGRGWKAAAPNRTGWAVELTAAKVEDGKVTRPESVTVRQGDKVVRRLDLAADETVDDYALLPGKPPLLALALQEAGEPRLYLYDLSTGDRLRRYTWHTDRIRALAFSGDGRLLASVADDQTACVWSLTQLDMILGRHGALKGVAVKEGDSGKGVVVTAVDAAGPAGGKLTKDDVIEGIVEGENLKPFATPRAYYEGVADVRPGREVTLRVRAPGAKPREVVLPVGQGVDERKPLLSLFVTRGGKAAEREWVGWSPYGPYEASGRKAERHIGWHFNTGKPAAPASFALADEYRKRYYREGILKHLVAKGSLAPAVEAWQKEERAKPAPRPTLEMDLDGAEAGLVPDARGEVVLRRPPRALALRMGGGFPEDRVASLRWDVGGEAKPLRPVAGRWEADLSGVTWRRQAYTLRVVLRTAEEEPREYVKEVALRYRPEAPALEFDPGWQKKHFGKDAPQRLVVREAAGFTVEAVVRPAREGEKVQVHLRRGDGTAEALELRDGKVAKAVELKEGDNVIELTATNAGATAETRDAETARRALVVTYVPVKKVPAPVILLTEVEALGGGAKALPVDVGRPVVVESRKVRVRGKITAEANLTEATRDKESLTKFRTGTAKETDIAEELTLKPGRQEVKFAARTKDGPAATAALTIDYRPPLPQVVWMTPPNGVFYEGEDGRDVTITACLVEPADAERYAAAVLHGDKALPDEPKIAGRTLTAKVTLADGENRFRVRLTNAWGGAAVSDDLLLRYARPPRDITFDKPVLGPKPLADLSATVKTPTDLLPESVAATLNGRSIQGAEVKKEPDGQTWRVLFKDVPLDAGDNEVRLAVANREGHSRKPGVLKFTFKPSPTVAAPEVRILEPAGDSVNVTRPGVTLRFHVKSAAALKRLELVREGTASERQPFDLSALKPGAGGVYELKVKARLAVAGAGEHKPIDPTAATADAEGYRELTLDLPLEPRDNRLRVEAVNDGGAGSVGVVVSYVPPPVRLVFDEIQEPTVAAPVPAKVAAGGRVTFAAPAGAALVLRGRVLWDEAQDEQLKQVKRVRVYVNGFQQPPADLDRPTSGGRERRFTASLILNRAAGNLVEVELPDSSQEINNRPSFAIDCKKPLTEQRLHLLVVSLKEEDEKKLTERALAAFRTPAFAETKTYLLAGDVTPEAVFGRLSAIRRAVARRATAGATNDVVVVYYAGAETVGAAGHYFKSNRADPDPRLSGISCRGLADYFPELLGAHLFVLDVTRQSGPGAGRADLVAAWPEDVRAGVFRSAWLKESEAVPPGARLLAAWGEAAPRARRLKDVDAGVDELFTRAFGKSHTASLAYDRHVPVCLEEMRVGRGP